MKNKTMKNKTKICPIIIPNSKSPKRDICQKCDNAKSRTFYLVMIGCSCNDVMGHKFITYDPSKTSSKKTKCPYCGKLLGRSEYGPIQTVRARTNCEAEGMFHGYFK